MLLPPERGVTKGECIGGALGWQMRAGSVRCAAAPPMHTLTERACIHASVVYLAIWGECFIKCIVVSRVSAAALPIAD